MSDTHPDALRVWLEIQGRLTPEQKFRQVVEMYESITAAQTAEVRRLYPAATEHEIFLRVTARRLGLDLMKKAANPRQHPLWPVVQSDPSEQWIQDRHLPTAARFISSIGDGSIGAT